ncbi:MAG: hypothetical protein V8Q90_06075 [Bacilli bacterium]|jgi:hypothetical protein|nr:unknown [Firmicutes bacterium CAG:345]
MAKKKTKGVSLVGLIFAIVVLAATIISGVSFCLDLFKIDVNIKQLETIIKIQDLGFDRGEEIFFLVSWIIGLVGLFVALVGEAGKVFKKNVNYIIIIGSLIALVGGVLEIIAGYNYVKFLNDTFNNPIYVPTITVEIGVWLSSIAGIGGGLFGLLSCTKICR